MTPSLVIRPVLALFLTAGVSACGMVDSDPHRFENLARGIASVPLDGSEPAPREQVRAEAPVASAAPVREGGLRPALRVEVMDPHALWDARDGIVQASAQAAAPVVAEAAVNETRARLQRAVDRTPLRPALQPATVRQTPERPVERPAAPVRASTGLVQLGAFSSEQSARAAWARLSNGSAGWALQGLTPHFEPVSVNGRALVRLKVRTPASGAAAVCAAAGIDDPWCRRSA